MSNNLKNICRLIETINNVNDKKIHNIAYILKKLGFEIDELFRYRNNGPYSSELQLELGFLLDKNFISKDINGTYYINKEKDMAKVDPLSKSESCLNTKEYETLIKQINSLSQNELEVIATTYYLLAYGYDFNENLDKKLRFMRKDLPKEVIDNSLVEYKALEQLL